MVVIFKINIISFFAIALALIQYWAIELKVFALKISTIQRCLAGMLYICPHREPLLKYLLLVCELVWVNRKQFELEQPLCVYTAIAILALVLIFGSATVYPNLRKQEADSSKSW